MTVFIGFIIAVLAGLFLGFLVFTLAFSYGANVLLVENKEYKEQIKQQHKEIFRLYKQLENLTKSES